MRRAFLVLLLLVAVGLLATPAFAEKIIFFKNGTSMPIHEFVVEDEMIHVDLGGNGFMAFPFEVVERVEDSGREISLWPSNVQSPNDKRRPDPTRAYPVTGVRTQRATGGPAKGGGSSAGGTAQTQLTAVGGAGGAGLAPVAQAPRRKGDGDLRARRATIPAQGQLGPSRGRQYRPEVTSLTRNPNQEKVVLRPKTGQAVERSSETEKTD